MSRLAQAATTLRAALRNPGIRRVELAWGAAIAAEWAHFVALGVFAYGAGGTSAVGVAGLARLLPAALVAPFASTLGDRFRRERFMTGTAAVGALALGASALVFFTSKSEWLIFALAAVIGVSSTLFRPALQAILPSLARTPEELIAANGATSTIESLGTLLGPLLAGALEAVRRGPALLILVLMATQGFVRGCLNVLIVVAAFRVLDAGDGAVGVLTAA